jgi:hypothetical protein
VNLNESQRKFIKDRVTNVWKGKRECPICISRTTWAISPLVEVREFNEGNHCPGAGITALTQVECQNCGYTVLFNAIALGVVDRDTGKVKEDKP